MRVSHIHERNNMEISVPGMPSDRVQKFILFEEPNKLRKKLWKILRANHDVVYEWRRALAMHMLSEKIETFPSDGPVFLRFGFGSDDAGFKSDMRKSERGTLNPLFHLRLRNSGEFRKEYQLWESSPEDHKEFWNK